MMPHSKSSTTSSWAQVRPAACLQIVSRPMAIIACCCWKPAAKTATSGSIFRSATANCSRTRRSIGSMHRSRSRSSATAESFSRAERCWGDRVDQWAPLHPRPAGDFDHWRQLGNAGWSFEDVLPYFRRAENSSAARTPCTGWAGHTRSDVCEPHPLCEAFITAARQAGFPRNDDFNGPTRKAPAISSSLPATAAVLHGRGYLRPARHRPNLAIVTDARATRILFDGRRRSASNIGRAEKTRTARRQPRGPPCRWRV